MKEIRVLDCTLRDGGYVNNWEFGRDKIFKVVDGLTSAGIDIIECGFLSNKHVYNEASTQFISIDSMKPILPLQREHSKYVCMINFGEYEINDIPQYDGSSVDGIRVVFHRPRMEEALDFCADLKKKGYLVFIQPMVTMNYPDQELIHMIGRVNDIKPYAFYIVDSFGVARRKDIMRLFYLIDNNLKAEIRLGYHSHNNLQLAYSNAQSLVELYSDRNLIIDSSVFGMGRGAGNLNTELFIEYLNEYIGSEYKVFPLLKIIDNILNKIYSMNFWGYSLPFYLSAKYNCHPDYASYLAEKHSLTVESMDYLISSIPRDTRATFKKDIIDQMYVNYQQHYIDDSEIINRFTLEFKNKRVLLIAPGGSINQYYDTIMGLMESDDVVSLCINFKSEKYASDYIFFSNEMRYEQFKGIISLSARSVIVTSNVQGQDCIRINYGTIRNQTEGVEDNAVLMLLKLLIRCDVKNVLIAGFDGYELNEYQNYADKDMILGTKMKNLIMLNKAIRKELCNLESDIRLEYITPSRYNRERILKDN